VLFCCCPEKTKVDSESDSFRERAEGRGNEAIMGGKSSKSARAPKKQGKKGGGEMKD